MDKREIFHALDIKIQVSPSGSIDQNYDLVQHQVEDLDDAKL